MSKNYDNWERLVGAVVRREKDRQLALTHSRDSSSISVTTLDLSFNSTARFDEDDVEWNNYNDVWEKLARVVVHREGKMRIAQTSPLSERIQYSDLQTLHHSDWKTMLLPHQKQQVVWRSASLIFFPDTRARTGGKNCFLVGSKNIEDINYEHPEFMSNTKSRFSEVLEIHDPEDLDVGCRIKTQMLSPNTLYDAYLVFALIEKHATRIDKSAGVIPLAAISTLKMLPYESVYRSKDIYNTVNQRLTVFFEQGNSRSDGWMEVGLGYFYVYPGEDREVQVRLACYNEGVMNMRRLGLIIEGIEFRPSEDKYWLFSKSNQFDDDDDDDDDDPPSPRIQKGDQLLPITISTGKNSLMLGARALLITWEDTSLCWKWTTHHHSRFPEVVELKYVWWLKIRGKINTRMLPPKTDYAAFLVFNLAEGCRGLEQAKGMVRFLDESENDAEKGARILNLSVAVSRADGWMEIEMGKFYVDKGNEREVESQLLENRCILKSGLIVEGIEFRPVYLKKHYKVW